ncbi:MAG: hypothetical protein A2W03_04205 [Candidatus Aminicenantes bacterium RBG_16_63_16]|nr:MAG: hypothetical protein A2W03_04205 [Candidatus Aminicenantes bacterium RBG_16_63_16]
MPFKRFCPGASVVSLCLILTGFSIGAQSPSSEPTILRVYSIALNEYGSDFDGQWQGITVASDGNCYFGASTHSNRHGAGFFRFDPVRKKLTVLARDMTLVCGEDLRTGRQGKIHSPIVEHEGWLYFATHLANYWPEAEEAYPGAHVLGLELKTGKFRDFGVLKKGYSIYSFVNVDPVGNCLYAVSTPFAEADIKNDGCRIFRIDIATGRKTDLGLAKRGKHGAFWSFINSQGDCWFTFWRDNDGDLYCARGRTGRIEKFPGVLPRAEYAFAGGVSPNQGDRGWTWVAALPGQEKCLFTMSSHGGGDERLWLFDPAKDIGSGAAFRALREVGPVFLALSLAGDRVYFVQREDPVSNRGWSGEMHRDDPVELLNKQENFHVRSVAIDAAAKDPLLDHGRIIDQDGRTPRSIDSLAADEKGRVYMVGDWHILPTDKGTLQIEWENPDRNFMKVRRGQFFAFADVSGKLK